MRSRMSRIPLVAVCSVLILFYWRFAHAAEEADGTLSRRDLVSAIAAQLRSSSPKERENGIASIHDALKGDDKRAAHDLNKTWYALLIQSHRYQEAADLCLQAAVSNAEDLNLLTDLQKKRVASLIACGRNDEALQAAKGLYNISWLRRTADAINLLDDVLIASDPDDGQSKAAELEKEQVSGADSQWATTGSGATSPAASHSAILAGIKVDSHLYQRRLKELDGASDFEAMYARGNLFLLADRPADALQEFRKAYAVAPDQKLAAATEAMARAMRAQDGTTARANAWMAALLPENRYNSASSNPATSEGDR